MKKKLISGLFLMLWMALMIFNRSNGIRRGFFRYWLQRPGVWVACLLTWAVIPVATHACVNGKNGPLSSAGGKAEASDLLLQITRKAKTYLSAG